jgi:hypothetical protein
MPYTNRIKARFWAKVSICEHGKECPDCCWMWTGTKLKKGYGRLYLHTVEGKRSILAVAHRVAWELAHSEFISNDLFCCHYCDSPPCVNPRHLWLGTHQDNVADRQRKGRGAKGERHGWYTHPESRPRGEMHWSAKLTAEQVREIRARSAGERESIRSLARTYGVSRGTIHSLVQGRTWRHVT